MATRAEKNRMRDMELARVKRDMGREKQVGTMKRNPTRGRPKKPKTMMSRDELNKMRNMLLDKMTKDIKQIVKPKKNLKVVGKMVMIKPKKK
tara:strand:- start:1106 stop:1381 length:276 start_codon:yes stop_codon:yes gene_type:complete